VTGAPSGLLVFIALLALAAAGAGWLWWRRRERARRLPPPAELRELIPASNFVEITGGRVHYVQAGHGPDLVLIHGIGASVFIWRFLLPLLETRFRVTAIDLPGFGQSSKGRERDYGLDGQTEAVATTLTRLGIERATLVGSSMGGALALWLAKLYPDRFPTVIALSPATDPRLVPMTARPARWLTPVLRRALNRHTMRLILERVLARHELITPQVVERYLLPFRDGGESIRSFWAATRLLADKRLPGALSGLPIRVLLIYGNRDQMVPRRVIARLMELLPRAELLVHDGGGHHIMEDEPLWTAETIVNFVASSTT